MVSEQPLTPAIFALLLVLHRGERHGYALLSEVEELTAGTVRLGPATLYRSLQRMRVDDLVEEIATESVASADLRADRRAERRRSYRITEAGRAAAAAEARRLAVMLDAVRRAGLLVHDPDDRSEP
jgi:DNA-binding PadR family transcriptional regulator